MVAQGRVEPMKIKIKKPNPAFKLRQVLPQLPNLSGRVAAKEIAKEASAAKSVAGATGAAWVTTE